MYNLFDCVNYILYIYVIHEENVVNNLKTLRKSLGMTQKSLAKEIGQTISSICHYESGRRQPDINICHQLATALGRNGAKVAIEDIFPNPDADSNAV